MKNAITVNIDGNSIAATVEANILDIVASFSQVVEFELSTSGWVSRTAVDAESSFVFALEVMATVIGRIETVAQVSTARILFALF